jgi:hypothetical protein
VRAALVARKRNLPFNAARRLLQTNLHVVAEVDTYGFSSGSGTPCSSSHEDIEDVAEAAESAAKSATEAKAPEQVFEVNAAKNVFCGPAAPDASEPELIVLRPLLIVREDRVSFGNLSELLCGIRSLVPIGMILKRQLAVRPLDVLL